MNINQRYLTAERQAPESIRQVHKHAGGMDSFVSPAYCS